MKERVVNETRPGETARIEAFSDGVFSISITLLVLELIQFLHIKDNERLLSFLSHNWHPFIAFVIGFVTILICWINHHHAFTYINRTDSSFMWVNGFLLFMITLTPFPTAILAEFLKTEGRIALSIYGFNYFLISIAAYGICVYAQRKGLVQAQSRDFFSCVTLTYKYGVFYTFIACIVCFFSIVVALSLYFILFSVFAFPKEFASRLFKIRKKRNAARRINNPGHTAMNKH
jgi:uncharacterized membrane protein